MDYAGAQLKGNLCKDPEVRYTQDGKMVTNLVLAVNTGVKEREKASFYKLVAWGKAAETLSKYCSKGDMMFFACVFETEVYEDQEGNKKQNVVFTVRDFNFLKTKGHAQQQETNQHQKETNQQQQPTQPTPCPPQHHQNDMPF